MGEISDFVNGYRARAGIAPPPKGAATSLVFDDRYILDFDLVGRNTVVMTTALLARGSEVEFEQKLRIVMNVGLALSSRTRGSLTIDQARDAVVLYDTVHSEGSFDEKCFDAVDRFVNEVATFHVALDRQPGFGREVGRARTNSPWRS
jgi:hypothetical protein